MANTEMVFDEADADYADEQCPTCGKVTKTELRESLNFGNIIAICTECEDEYAYTPIDHKAILAEARRGW